MPATAYYRIAFFFSVLISLLPSVTPFLRAPPKVVLHSPYNCFIVGSGVSPFVLFCLLLWAAGDCFSLSGAYINAGQHLISCQKIIYAHLSRKSDFRFFHQIFFDFQALTTWKGHDLQVLSLEVCSFPSGAHVCNT